MPLIRRGTIFAQAIDDLGNATQRLDAEDVVSARKARGIEGDTHVPLRAEKRWVEQVHVREDAGEEDVTVARLPGAYLSLRSRSFRRSVATR